MRAMQGQTARLHDARPTSRHRFPVEEPFRRRPSTRTFTADKQRVRPAL